MGKPTGFLEYQRKDPVKRPVQQRVRDYKEFEEPLNADEIRNQAARCMGLRHSLLPCRGLSVEESHSGLE